MGEYEDHDGLAPVIPIFGGGAPRAAVTHDEAVGPADEGEHRYPVRRLPRQGEEESAGDGSAAPSRSAVDTARTPESGASSSRGVGDDGPGGAREGDGSRAARPEPEAGDAAADADEEWHTTWRGPAPGEVGLRPAPRIETVERGGVHFLELPNGVADAATGRPSLDETAEKAERRLLRSLGSRGLSVSEARAKLRQQDLPAEAIDDVIDRLERAGALDDAKLAEQIVFQATTHRNEGRKAIAQSLAKRGISRDTIEAVVAELPDDDYERALEFARGKARQLARLDDDVALRRLVGQLSRRGYGGLAMSVARRALDEQARPTRGTVRFE
ncbi:regulatory protein RecX [Microbacterium halophytorum]|uniref:regulatory protein RecX n=1 Tax=Microbacterium halophytorum TaxID=2067568 RepID=UPI000CFA8D46|nr:regulatory protein RecX [Microbacterium halophytorum]